MRPREEVEYLLNKYKDSIRLFRGYPELEAKIESLELALQGGAQRIQERLLELKKEISGFPPLSDKPFHVLLREEQIVRKVAVARGRALLWALGKLKFEVGTIENFYLILFQRYRTDKTDETTATRGD